MFGQMPWAASAVEQSIPLHRRGCSCVGQNRPHRGWQLYKQSILLQELLPIILACAVWGPGRQDSSVVVNCDNLGMVAVVNTGYSKVLQIIDLLRCPFFIRVFFPCQCGQCVSRASRTVGRMLSPAINYPFYFPRFPGHVAGKGPSPPPSLVEQ